MKLPNARGLRAAFLVLAVTAAIPHSGSAAKKAPRKKSPVAVASSGDARWTAFDKAVAEAKYAEAADEAKRLRDAAIAAKDDKQWQRALVEEARLRDRLGASSEALRILRSDPWPAGKEFDLERYLLAAQTLESYLQRYRWEIRKRERIESKEALPIEKMTAEQIYQELAGTFQKLWAQRVSWEDKSNETLPAFVVRNDFPKEVRGTIRDTVTYLAAAALGNSSYWSPAEANEVTQLSLERMLEGTGPEMPGLADASVHPLLRATIALRDLESWHRAAGRLDAALEAKLERYRRVRAAVAESDRRLVSDALEKRLSAFKKAEWWSAGMADLSRFRQEEGKRREAHRLATLGAEEWPETPGGNRCVSQVKALERPDFRLETMAVDAAKKRSLLVHRTNLKALYFRAYALGSKIVEERSGRWNVLPGAEIVPSLFKRKPDATWEASFPEAHDFGEHQTYITPPMETPGMYVVLASMKPGAETTPNVVQGVLYQVSDHLLLREGNGTGTTTFSVVRGATGEPVAGAKVELFSFSWDQKPFRKVTKLETDVEGRVTYAHSANRESLFAVAEVKDDKGVTRSIVDPEIFSAYVRTKEVRNDHGFFYTDRAIYRPKQPLHWKLVVTRAKAGSADLAAAEGRKTKVELCDANGDVVAFREAKTDAYGTLAGKFEIPSGKLLGNWSLRASAVDAYSNVRVEEYKRPTFEVTLAGAKDAVRLNKPAVVEGEARYYFGMAVGDGQVKWRVTREPVTPPWWGWCGFRFRGHRNGGGESQTIASGLAKVDENGKFRIQFLPRADDRSQQGQDAVYRFQVSADVTDPGGETRSASRDYRLGAAAVQATIETGVPFFQENGGGSLTFRRTNLDGEPRKGKGTWRIVALVSPPGGPVMPADAKPSRRTDLPKWPRENREDTLDADEILPRWTPYESWQASLATLVDGAEVFRGVVEHGEDGNGTVPLPKLQTGAYRVRYDSEDELGKKVKTWRDVLVVGGPAALPVPAILEVDKSSAEPGDKVKVLAASGFAGQSAWFEVWRDGTLQRREKISGGDTALKEIAVTDADRGGFTVVLTMLRDYQLVRLTQDVSVPWTDRMLAVEFESFRDKMRPGGKETWALRVKAPKVGGKEATVAAAQVLAFMYDRSLDAFAPHGMGSPLSLLPSRTGAPGLTSPLGAGGSWHYRSDDLFPVPAAPFFQSDRFEQGEYDYEGLGEYRRGGEGGGGLRLRAMAAPKPAKAKMADKKASSEREEAEGLVAASTVAKDDADGNAIQQQGKLLPREPGPAQPPTDAKPVEVRSNFAETAFWMPQLLSAADGSVKLQFAVPDSVTSWRVLAHALTKDVKYGSVDRTARTVKELMVRPYLPRFAREGDTFTLRVAVNNAGDKPLEGDVKIEIFDADTLKSLAKAFDLGDATKSFSVKPGKATDVRYALKAPSRLGPVAVRVVAKAGDLSDGELRPMPLLPSRLHLVQSRFATLRDGEKRVLKFDELEANDDRTRVDEQMVLTVDGQLFNGVLKALPYLAKYAYECVEQTLNRFLSTSLVSAALDRHPTIAKAARTLAKRATPYLPFDQVDPNRKILLEETPWLQESRGGKTDDHEWANLLDASTVRRERESALEKLAKAQKSDGGFPWFAGGPSSRAMTLYVLGGFARALEGGVGVPKESVQRAWRYLAEEERREYFPWLRKTLNGSFEHAAMLAFVATAFPDPSWTEGGLTKAEVSELVAATFNAWKLQSRYVKAMLAWTLKREDRLADARLVLGSVLDAAKTEKDRGTFWQPEDRAWLWFNDTVESHAFLLRTTLEIEPSSPKVDGMALWLFLNRKLNHWKSTRATAEAIYALLKFVAADRSLGVPEKYVVEAGDFKQEVTFAPDAADTTARFTIPGDKIDPRKSSKVTFESKSRAFALASATWHFSTERMPRESSSDFFSVTRAFFVRENTPKGLVLKPLADGTAVHVGDEIEVQLSLKTKHRAEYVHLRDPRGAGFEPEGAVSGYKWDDGIGWYEEYRDSATNFFFENLPAGEYPFRYRIRATMAGKFRVGPATVQSMYAPEFAAYSAGALVPVKD